MLRSIIFLAMMVVSTMAIMPHEVNDADKLAQVNLNAHGYMEEQAAQGFDVLSEAGVQYSMILRKLEELKADDAASPDGMIVGTTPLSPTCATYNCDFFYYFLTCKQIGIDMDHICASYFVGWLFSCDGYPAQSTIQNAPSVCLGQFAQKALPVLIDAKNKFTNITAVTSYESACQHNCFQNYMKAASTFINECYYEMGESPAPTNALQALYSLNAYYSTSCAVGTVTTLGVPVENTNCFDTLLQLKSNPAPAIPGYIMPFDNYWCNSTTPMIFYCPFGFEQYGCCYSNIVALAEQLVTSNDSLTILPPCVQRYLYVTGCSASLTTSFCTNGTVTNTTIVQGSIQILSKPASGFPDVYNADSVVMFQAQITAAFMANPAVANKQVMLALGPNIEISNYTYYGVNGTALTPDTGIAPDDMSDYTNAQSVTFWFNVVQIYSSQERAAVNNAWLASPNFAAVLAAAMGTTPDNLIVKSENPDPFFYPAQPFDTAHYNAGSSLVFGSSVDRVIAMTMIITTVFAVMLL